jgi:iron complex outermembrane receptor protein
MDPRKKKFRSVGKLLPMMVLATAFVVRLQAAIAEEGIFSLGEIEVVDQSEQDKNTSNERISAEEMRERGKDTINEAAGLAAGVTLSTTGPRNEGTLYLRGLDIKHAPIFLDGIPIYVPYDGYPDLNRFTTFDLSEIVISKGFTSVLYGPNTMGGAINMVSRRPERSLEGDISAGYGLNNEVRSFANLGTKQEKWYLQGGASYTQRDDYRLANHFAPSASRDGDGTRDNSYRRDARVSLKAGYTPNQDDEYTIGGDYQHGRKGVSPYAGSDSRTAVRYWKWPYWNTAGIFASTKTKLPAQSYVKTRIYYDIFRNSLNSYDDATYTTVSKGYAFRSHYDDYTVGASAEAGTLWLPHQQLKLALHYKADVHREQNEGSPLLHYKDELGSVGLEDTVTINKQVYAIAGVSEDGLRSTQAENLDAQKVVSDFPHTSTSAFNPQAGLFYTLGEMGTFRASVARKSRLPSIKDRYSYRLGSAIPNPDLAPERSTNFEVGFSGKPISRLKINVAAYYHRVSDYVLLVTVPDPATDGKTTGQNQNIGQVSILGTEGEAVVTIHRMVEVGGTYTFTRAHNDTNQDRLTGIPRHRATGFLRLLPIPGLSILADGEYDSSRFSSSDGVQVADSYFVMNARARYELPFRLSAQVELRNLTDRTYALQEGYPEPGRTIFFSLGYRL